MKNTVGKNIVKLRKEQGCPRNSWPKSFTSPGRPCPIGKTGRSQPDLDMLEALASAFETDILVVIYGQMPAGEDEETRSAVRKRHLKKAVFWGILTLASYLILTALGRHLDVLKTRTYNSMPYILLQTSVMPLISMGFAVSLMHVLNVAGTVRITESAIRKKTSCGGRTVSRTLHALYAVAVCPLPLFPEPPVDLAHVLFRYPPYPVFSIGLLLYLGLDHDSE